MASVTIDDVIESARKKFESESVVMRFNEIIGKDIPVQKTGIPQLDIITGVGGLPKGRIIEVFGPESSGKSTTALTIISQAQKEGAWVWYGDMEHSLDPTWAETIGVNLDKMIISQPDHGEQCLQLAQHFIETGVIDLIVVDSVSALTPRAELEGEVGNQYIGLQARMMSQAMRMLTAKISKTKCIAIFINQIRDKIGVRFGSPETTSGGRALKFFSSVRIDVRRTGAIGKKEDGIGNTIKFTIAKNKVAPPFKIGEAELYFENGFDFGHNILNVAVEKGKIDKNGNSYKFGEIELGVGLNKSARVINEMTDEVKEKLYSDVIGVLAEERKKSSIERKILKYTKKLEKTTDEEEKKKWQEKIDKYKAQLENKTE